MNKITVKLLVVMPIIGLMCFILPHYSFAQERRTVGQREHPSPIEATGIQKLENNQEDISSVASEGTNSRRERLKELRDKNPKEFKVRREALLKELKEKHPEKYDEFIRHRRNKDLRKYLERLKKKDPEKYRDFIKKYRARIKKFIEKYPKQKERLYSFFKHRKDKDYNALQDFLNNHPEYKKEWLTALTPEEIQHLKLSPKELKDLKHKRPEVFDLYVKHHPGYIERLRNSQLGHRRRLNKDQLPPDLRDKEKLPKDLREHRREIPPDLKTDTPKHRKSSDLRERRPEVRERRVNKEKERNSKTEKRGGGGVHHRSGGKRGRR